MAPSQTPRFLVTALILGLGSHVFAAQRPDTLVVKKGSGFGAGAATVWKQEGKAVVFTLASGFDVAATVEALKGGLVAEVTQAGGNRIRIEGVAMATLLEQLSNLSLSGAGADPLAALAGLGPGVGMDRPEGGGSIRASKVADLHRPRTIPEHDPKERVTADVVKIERGEFPTVTLTLKLRSSAKAGPLKKKLRRGRTVAGPVVLAVGDGGIDFDAVTNQRNLAAFYLERGDRVTVHLAGDQEVVGVDFVERIKR